MAEKLEGSNLGPFTILRPLGAGAMGVVWLAQHHETGIKVALKMINAGAALANPASVARFEREAGILKQLKHPNIVRLSGGAPGTHWQAELARGDRARQAALLGPEACSRPRRDSPRPKTQ